MFPEVKAFVNDLRAHYRAVGLPDANKSRLMQLRSKACTARQSAIRPAPTFPPPSAVLPVLQASPPPALQEGSAMQYRLSSKTRLRIRVRNGHSIRRCGVATCSLPRLDA